MTGPRRRPGVLFAGVLLALTFAGAGCTVTQPSASDWSITVSRSLEEAASAVGTARLSVRELRADRVWGGYALTLAADAEEQVATASDSVATLQRPRGVSVSEQTAVLDLFSRAEDAVQAARQFTVADRDGAGGVVLRKRLDRIRRALLDKAAAVR